LNDMITLETEIPIEGASALAATNEPEPAR